MACPPPGRPVREACSQAVASAAALSDKTSDQGLQSGCVLLAQADCTLEPRATQAPLLWTATRGAGLALNDARPAVRRWHTQRSNAGTNPTARRRRRRRRRQRPVTQQQQKHHDQQPKKQQQQHL